MKIRPIKTKADHEAALARIEELWDAAPGSEDADALEVLAVLVDAYEAEIVDIPPPNPIDAILLRMEQRGMTRAELQQVLGVTRGRLSEVLSGKRELSKAMIRRLVDQLHIPADVLINPVSEAQEAVRRRVSGDAGLVDELIEERRSEARTT